MLVSCQQQGSYPETRRDSTVDTYFGVEVPDPYRWLECDTAAEVRAWVKAQNAVTEAYLEKIPYRQQLAKRIGQLYEYDSESAPQNTGKYYLYYRKPAGANQAILYIKDSLSGEGRVLLDPNTFISDGTQALTLARPSHDSRYLAYMVADGGSDWQTICVLDLPTGAKHPDTLSWVKFSDVAWRGDGFYYSRYAEPRAAEALTGRNEYQKIYYHRLGTPQQEDRLIFQDLEHPLRSYVAQVTEDEKYLIVSETESTSGCSLYVKNLEKEGDFVQLTTGYDYDYSVVGNIGDDLYVLTNYRAPKYKLVRINMDRTDIGAWEDVIPEQKDVLLQATLVDGKLAAEHMHDASSLLSIYDLRGQLLKDVDLGILGSLGGLSARNDAPELFFSLTSFTMPAVVYSYDVRRDEKQVLFSPKFDFDFSNYVVEQVFYPSTNGVTVPMFLVHRKDLKLNGKNPTLLYGYGGFNISLTPSFSSGRLAWLEQGGIYAMACIRGGGEYGEKWHRSGTKLNKQNVFDDFIAAAEYLVDKKYTSSKYLAIQGGSNGGLLIGAVVNQRPGLFAVAIPQVGVMDMLRYQHFTIGWAWADDYGTSDEEFHFKNLYSYSPLHNIAAGSNYPAILVTTADHDDRVVPAHSFKYIATLQAQQPGGKPKLIRIETRAGHGSGKPTRLVVEEQADIYSFIFKNMGLAPKF